MKKSWKKFLFLLVMLALAAALFRGGDFLVAAVGGLFGGGSQNTSADLTRGLVGYWDFEELAGTTANDRSANSNNGTICASDHTDNGDGTCTATFNIADTLDDGRVHKSDSPGYPPTTATVFDTVAPEHTRDLHNSKHTVRVALFRWDTQSLPDYATVTGANFVAYVTGKNNTNNRNVDGEWYDHNGIGTEDYSLNSTANAFSVNIDTVTIGQDNTFALTNLTNVSLTGYTGLRLHTSGNEAPGSGYVENFVNYADFGDAPTEARLVVTYTP